MHGHYDNSCLRRYIILMGELFNDVRVARHRDDGSKTIKVPISYGSKEKFIAAMNKINTPMTDSTVAKIETILPRMRLNMIDMSYAAEYKTLMLNRQVKSPTPSKQISLYNPVPYKLTFELGVYTRHESDMLNIVEQIVPYFQPHFCCNIKEIINEHTIKRDVNVNLTSVMIDEDADGGPNDRRRLEWTLTFDVVAWIYPPSNDINGQIKTIYLNFVAAEKELGDGSNMEGVVLKAMPEGVSQEDWQGDIDEE